MHNHLWLYLAGTTPPCSHKVIRGAVLDKNFIFAVYCKYVSDSKYCTVTEMIALPHRAHLAEPPSFSGQHFRDTLIYRSKVAHYLHHACHL